MGRCPHCGADLEGIVEVHANQRVHGTATLNRGRLRISFDDNDDPEEHIYECGNCNYYLGDYDDVVHLLQEPIEAMPDVAEVDLGDVVREAQNAHVWRIATPTPQPVTRELNHRGVSI